MSGQSSDLLTQMISFINSYNGKLMLAAIISLLLVISFVLLLHIYASWFLGQSHHRARRSVSTSNIRSSAYDYDYIMDGLDVSIIASLPIFVYKSDDYKKGLECTICLSVFENDEMGRNLPKCQHSFHVECIDIWLQSHSSCPICRAPVGLAMEKSQESSETISSECESGIVRENSSLELRMEMPPDSSLECQLPKHPTVNSLKRMLSRNRSEHKVFPSSTVNELNV